MVTTVIGTFPPNPSLNQVFLATNGVAYIWTGGHWELRPQGSGVGSQPIPNNGGIGGATGPMGPMGPQGARGFTGPTGWTGPNTYAIVTGPQYVASNAFVSKIGLFWYNTSTGELSMDLDGNKRWQIVPQGAGGGAIGPTGPAGVGLATGDNSTISSNLIPATGNLYSLGNSTNWWKDIWISANTFYVGGKPISVTANGQISIGDLVVTGSINGAAVNNVLNPVSGEPLITYNYTFDATLTDWNVYSGDRSVPDGKFIILGVGWPERPGVSLFGSNGTSGGFVNYMKMSGKTSDGTDIYQELKDKFAAAQYPNPSYTFIRLTEAGNPGNYCVFYWNGNLTSHDNSKTFEFAVTWITGTASSGVWTSNNTQIIVEFSQKTMHGRIPLMDAQKYWWTKPHFFGPGFDMEVPYSAPLCCSGLWLYPPASNTGTVNFPTGNVWIGKSVTVWVFGNSLAKSNLVNVRTTSLPTTITANSFFNITYLDNNLMWAVTYQGNI